MSKGKREMTAVRAGRRIPRRYLLLALGLLTLLSTSVLLAKYVTNNGEYNNKFAPVQVSCTVNEEVTGNTKTEITVTNTSTVDVYIRVRLVSYWQTPSGNIAGKTSEMPKFTPGDGWIAYPDDTYYYSARVTAGMKTDDLLNGVMTLTAAADADGYIQVVKILAEAIQADGVTESGKPAVEDAWGVTLKDGYIVEKETTS